MDMKASSKDAAEDISEYFMQAMLSEQIGTLYQDKLKKWYEKFAKGMEDAKQKAMEWQVGQMLLNCDDFEEIVMFLAQRKKLKKEMSNG